MNILKILLILFFIGIISKVNAQEWTHHKMLNVGYTYQNHNFGEIGGKVLFLKDDDAIYRFGGGVLLGSVHQKIVAIPKIESALLFNFQKNVDVFHSYYYLAGIEATTKYIAPKMGISLFGIMDFTVGYGFSISKEEGSRKLLKGLNLGMTINIPTTVLF